MSAEPVFAEALAQASPRCRARARPAKRSSGSGATTVVGPRHGAAAKVIAGIIRSDDRPRRTGTPRSRGPARSRCRRAVALIVLGLAWELWLAPTGRGTLAIKVLPLLLPLPGCPHAPLHLSLAEPAGLALRRRRRGAGDQRARHRRPGWPASRWRCALLALRRLRRARAWRRFAPAPAASRDMSEPARAPARRRRRRQRAGRGDLSAWEVDWRKRCRGKALAVVRPGSTAEVAAGGARCAPRTARRIVAQGGNTGLVGGSVPDASGRQVLLEPGAARTGCAASTRRT